MNQSVRIWRGNLPRLAFAGLLAIASLGAHAQSYTSYPVGGSSSSSGYYGNGGYHGGYVPPLYIPPVFNPPLPAGVNTLTWSKNASSAYALNQLSGSFYDKRVGITITTASGRQSTYQAYAKTINPSAFTRDATGNVASGAIIDTLTWTGAPNEDVMMTGGSFTLSNIHWNLNATGSANVWATASGTGIATTELLAFTVPAVAISRTASYANLDTLSMTSGAFEQMALALGADVEGLAYTSLWAAGANFGKLSMAAVPEAATWAQLGLGLLGLGIVMRRQAGRRCGAAAEARA
jgi:hypothetical protein